MASLSNSFLVSYAGVPLLTDVAKVIRQPPPEVPHGQVDKQQPVRKQQPEVDLIDELNRLLDFDYLQEFHLPSPFHNRNLSAIARYSDFGPQPGMQVKIGDFYYPTGASRWGLYRGLATSTMVKTILQIIGTETVYIEGQGFQNLPAWKSAPFVMRSAPFSPNNQQIGTTNYTVQTNMFLLPPRPLAEYGNKFDGLFLISLVDPRYKSWFQPISLKITASTTWDGLIQQIAQAKNITISYPPIPSSYGQPEPDSQLWLNYETTGAVFDAIALNLGRIVVRNLDGTYELQTYDQAQQIVTINRGNANQVVRFAGGDIFNSGKQHLAAGDLTASRNAAVPANVMVTFPKYVIGNDPVPHFVNARYQNPRPSTWYEESYGDVFFITIPVSSGGPLVSGLVGFSGYTHVIHDTAKALYSGEVQAASGVLPLNISGGVVSGGFTPGLVEWVISGGVAAGYNSLSGVIPGALTSGLSSLSILAARIAQDYYSAQALEALDESYPGTLSWTPEGIHDIVWRYSERSRQATTRVLKRQWNTVVREMQHTTPISQTEYDLSGNITGYSHGTILFSVPGVGGPSVPQTWRDSISGSIQTAVDQTYLAGDRFINLSPLAFLPTQNRWKARISSGQIDDEVMLLEGTSGGVNLDGGDALNQVGVVLQGIDGTIAKSHLTGAIVLPIQHTQYGVNLGTLEKNQNLYPHEMQSGGIYGIRVVPQMQSVYTYSASGLLISGIYHYSGSVFLYEPEWSDGSGMARRELVWIVERSSTVSGRAIPITSGRFYAGMLAGYSIDVNSHTAPVYLIDEHYHAVIAQIQHNIPDPTTGLYSGIWQTYNPASQTWGNSQFIWLRDANT